MQRHWCKTKLGYCGDNKQFMELEFRQEQGLCKGIRLEVKVGGNLWRA